VPASLSVKRYCKLNNNVPAAVIYLWFGWMNV